MNYEIERRFLVKPENLKKAWKNYQRAGVFVTEHRIEQGYLSVGPAVRVRIDSDHSSPRKRKSGTLTIKGKAVGKMKSKRPEFNFNIHLEEATDLLSICAYRIKKTRYRVQDNGFTWEVDVFAAPLNGLIIAEIELESESQKFTKPSWIGPEITGIDKYSNAALAKKIARKKKN